MTIWWCLEHKSSSERQFKKDPNICFRWALFLAHGKELTDCRMVEMRLTPVETLATWGPDHPSYDEMGQ
jgi:hypothetical protein